MDYKKLREQFYKVIEQAYNMPDSKDATEDTKHIDLYNIWEREFAKLIIEFDKQLKELETIEG